MQQATLMQREVASMRTSKAQIGSMEFNLIVWFTAQKHERHVFPKLWAEKVNLDVKHQNMFFCGLAQDIDVRVEEVGSFKV